MRPGRVRKRIDSDKTSPKGARHPRAQSFMSTKGAFRSMKLRGFWSPCHCAPVPPQGYAKEVEKKIIAKSFLTPPGMQSATTVGVDALV